MMNHPGGMGHYPEITLSPPHTLFPFLSVVGINIIKVLKQL